jgi:hypothetical protein
VGAGGVAGPPGGLQLDRPPGLGLLAGPAPKRAADEADVGVDGEVPVRDVRQRLLCDDQLCPTMADGHGAVMSRTCNLPGVRSASVPQRL